MLNVYNMTEDDYAEAPAISAAMDEDEASALDRWFDHVTSDRLNGIIRDVDAWARRMTDTLADVEMSRIHSLPVNWKE